MRSAAESLVVECQRAAEVRASTTAVSPEGACPAGHLELGGPVQDPMGNGSDGNTTSCGGRSRAYQQTADGGVPVKVMLSMVAERERLAAKWCDNMLG